jgi:DNA modification methylase
LSNITWTLRTFDIASLTDYFKNPRSLSKDQFAQLKTSLDKFGMIDKPIINADDAHTVIGGHQRLHVLRAEGVKSVECWYPSRLLDEREVEELNIRLNKNTGNWDFDVLANSFEILDLVEWGFTEKELQLGGFDLDQAEGEDPGAQIDKAEELRVKWGVESGQLWKLGEHRLICGDCTDRAVVERVMGGEKAGALLNDPPYGMRLDADFSGMVNHLDFANEKGVKNGNKYSDVIGDDKDYDASPIMAIFSDVKEQFWFGADYYSTTLGDTMHEGAWIIWDKRLDESADKMYGSCFEMLWSRQKHKRDILRHKWAGIFGTEHEPQRGRMHPNQKPIELYEDILTRYTDKDAVIVDCYAGSGTTLIACERLSRKCRAVEISPAYVAVAIDRWVTMTGGTPELIDSLH